MPIQDCLLVNLRETGSFKLTAQRLADIHTVTVNINFPSDPQSGDMHLVDYDGDNWWVLYRYGAGVWTLYAEIEGNQTVDLSGLAEDIDNVPKVIWVNSESDPTKSAVHNPNKPFTTLVDAIAEIPAGITIDSDLEAILANTGDFNYGALPNMYTVKLVGDNYYLTAAELATIDTDKSFKLFLESGLKLQALANLGTISEDIISISGPGYIYKNGTVSTDPMFTVASSVKNVEVDLDTIYFKSGVEAGPSGSSLAGPVFRLDNLDGEASVRLKTLVLNLAILAVLPGEFNKGTNFVIDKVSSAGGFVHYLFKFPEVSLGSTSLLQRSTNITIGQLNPVSSSITGLFVGRPASLYGYHSLNISIDQLTNYKSEWALMSFFGGDYEGSDINVNIKQSFMTGPYLSIRNGADFNGNISVHVEKESGKTASSVTPYIFLLVGAQISGRVSFSGNYVGNFLLQNPTGDIDNLYIEGNYETPTVSTYPAFIHVTTLPAGSHKIYLNNCKIIDDTALPLVDGSSITGTLTLVCSNVHTNMMGALPGWVTIEGDLTQNVNYL